MMMILKMVMNLMGAHVRVLMITGGLMVSIVVVIVGIIVIIIHISITLLRLIVITLILVSIRVTMVVMVVMVVVLTMVVMVVVFTMVQFHVHPLGARPAPHCEPAHQPRLCRAPWHRQPRRYVVEVQLHMLLWV